MQQTPPRYALYSIAASLLTLALKFGAWFLTGSVGLFSDATESLVNLAAGVMALITLLYINRPADERHSFGHSKAEYFSSGFEGLLIFAAAVGIIWAAVQRFLQPAELTNLGAGLGVAVAAAGVNLFAARLLLSAGRRYDSITLEADAHHLMTDVWTSAGMVVGLSILLVWPSLGFLDPLIAVAMSLNIMFTGVKLVRRSVGGLLDEALPPSEIACIEGVIAGHANSSHHFHGLRTRKAGARRFIEFHLLVPGSVTVRESHDLCDQIENEITGCMPGAQVTIHVEPEEVEGAGGDGKKGEGETTSGGRGR